ncbi:MAG: hypothetical protein ACI9DK_002296 [Vicingaceae bacterium]|jgi:hypothetical protein
MKSIKTKFSAKTTLKLLATNWITMIVLTVYFLDEKNATSMAIIGTLLVGFTLQMLFMFNQMKLKRKEV